MEIREATPADSDRIREIAERSFQSSFALSPEEIVTLVGAEFSEGRWPSGCRTRTAGSSSSKPRSKGRQCWAGSSMGRRSDEYAGSTSTRTRGQGLGTGLVEHLREEHGDHPIVWEVLDDAVEGGEFCDQFGLGEHGRDWLDIGGHEFAMTFCAKGHRVDEPNEPTVPAPERVSVDGESRPLARDDLLPGREAPFLRIFASSEMGSPYGYFCSQCGSTAVSTNGLDRLECSDCGNVHLVDEWDGGYL